MINNILFVMWFFLPAGIANVVPVLVSKVPVLRNYDYPIDFGYRFKGKPLFGSHKTWRGLLFGIIFSILMLKFQVIIYNHNDWFRSLMVGINYNDLPVFGLGLLFAIGALGGDAIESFIKRQFNIDPGKRWFPFDQIDYILGGIITSSFIITLSFTKYVWLLIIWLILHLIFSFFAYLFKLKDSPI